MNARGWLPILWLACGPADDTAAPVPGDPPAPWSDPPFEAIGEAPALFDRPHGVYDAPFALTLTPVDGTEIRYTLDGADPTGPNALAYTGPISIDHTVAVRAVRMANGAAVGRPQTRTYVLPATLPAQQAPPTYPTAWWTADETGPYVADYGLDPDVTASSAWTDAAATLFRDAPILSVTLDPDALFGPNGIHENPTEQGVAWEREASFEVFGDGLDTTVRCGLRIQGGAGRRPDRSPKKSFRVAFRSDYGTSRLESPLFPDSPIASFDTLVLRAGYNRTWVHFEETGRQRAQYLHERYTMDLGRASGTLAPHVRLVHLFLNGLYWGVYQLEERPDEAFQADYLGGSEDDYDSINAGFLNGGDLVAWDELLRRVRLDLADPANYASVEAMLDIDDFIAYMLVNLTLGNADWPDKNWWAGRLRTDDAKWRFFLWDGELTLPSTTGVYTDVDAPNGPGEIFQALRANADFNRRFGDRVEALLYHDGALSSGALVQTWSGLAPLAYPTLVGESARWGDHWRDDRATVGAGLYTYEANWLPEHARVRDTVLPRRVDVAVADFVAKGLYPTTPAPLLAPFGGPLAADARVSLQGEGDVWYTLDGTDPRGADDEPSPNALRSTGALVLQAPVTVHARTRNAEGWSARIEATFRAP
ncbi:MAG: hypothetical protein RLZZ383_2 [Pseudomonadota bacterium]|jgi:hypothetical protein